MLFIIKKTLFSYFARPVSSLYEYLMGYIQEKSIDTQRVLYCNKLQVNFIGDKLKMSLNFVHNMH